MSFEYNVATYTLHLIGLYSVRYGKIVLTLTGRERRKFMANQIHVTKRPDGSWAVKQPDNQRASTLQAEGWREFVCYIL